MEITECIIDENGNRDIRTLYKYNVTDSKEINGKPKVIGHYEKMNDISEAMQKRLLENGMPRILLIRFVNEVLKESEEVEAV